MVFYKLECWVCGRQVDHDLDLSTKPPGWKDRPIAGGVYNLCDSCAPHSNLNDGMARQMADNIFRRHGVKVEIKDN